MDERLHHVVVPVIVVVVIDRAVVVRGLGILVDGDIAAGVGSDEPEVPLVVLQRRSVSVRVLGAPVGVWREGARVVPGLAGPFVRVGPAVAIVVVVEGVAQPVAVRIAGEGVCLLRLRPAGCLIGVGPAVIVVVVVLRQGGLAG